VPQDMEGQTFRIMQSEVIQAQFDLLGAKAQQESFNSTYNLIEEGKVDAEENTISNIYSKKFYNVQKHLTISDHGYLGYAVMMDQQVWDQQTENTKKILLESMQETTDWNDQNSIKMNEEQLELIKQNSEIQIYELTDTEKHQWMKELEPVYEELSEMIGEELVEDLKELRKRFDAETK